MDNPFQIFSDQLAEIKDLLQKLLDQRDFKTEIIDVSELASRLSVTRQTVMRWHKQGRIPFIQEGSIIRYNYPKVIEALEKQGRE